MRILSAKSWLPGALCAGLVVAAFAAAAAARDMSPYMEIGKKDEPNPKKPKLATEEAPLWGTLSLSWEKKGNRPRIDGITLNDFRRNNSFTIELQQQTIRRYLEEQRPRERDRTGVVAVVGEFNMRKIRNEDRWFLRISELYEVVEGKLKIEEPEKPGKNAKKQYILEDVHAENLPYRIVEPTGKQAQKDWKEFIDKAVNDGGVVIVGTLRKTVESAKKKKRDDEEFDVPYELQFLRDATPRADKDKK